MTLTLREDGDRLVGTAVNQLGQGWPVSASVFARGIVIAVAVEGDSNCSWYQLEATVFSRDPSGTVVALQGAVVGRCYGTVSGTFSFGRA